MLLEARAGELVRGAVEHPAVKGNMFQGRCSATVVGGALVGAAVWVAYEGAGEVVGGAVELVVVVILERGRPFADHCRGSG